MIPAVPPGKPASAGGSSRTQERLKQALQVCGYLFILGGSISLSIGIYMQLQDSGKSGEFYDTLLGRRWVLLMARIVAPVVCLPLGLLGFLGAALEKRWLLLTFACLLALAIIANATYVTYLMLRGFSTAADTPEKMASAIGRHYGNLGDRAGLKFTAQLDKYQKQYKCCGWDASPNKWAVFLGSLWHAAVNNATGGAAADDTKSGAAAPMKHVTVPESCCATEASIATKQCTTAADILKARQDKLLHPVNCLQQMKTYQSRLSCFVISGLAFATLVEVGCLAVTFTLLVLLHRSGKLSPPLKGKLGASSG